MHCLLGNKREVTVRFPDVFARSAKICSELVHTSWILKTTTLEILVYGQDYDVMFTYKHDILTDDSASSPTSVK